MKNKFILILTTLLMGTALFLAYNQFYRPAIKIGVMHSLTGTMAISEKGMVDAVLLAVEEINQQGGLLGRQIKPIVMDGQSDPEQFAKNAEFLIQQDNVDVVFGCWTSSCRKSVLPIFEQHDHLLYYPLQYEGLEASKNIIYLGAVPNQQIIPALEWTFSKYGKRIYLIGSDYVYPRAANEIIKDQAKSWRGNIVGETYVPLGSHDFAAAVAEIKQVKPDMIFSTINGASNLSFFKTLRANNIYPKDIPTFSFSISEDELNKFKNIEMSGDYLVWNYLQGLDNKLNQDFVKHFKDRYGENRSIGNPMVTAYMGVYLWAKAVKKAGSSDVEKVRKNASDLSIQGPSGMKYIEQKTQHTWMSMHIAKIGKQNQLQSVWFSKVPIAPKPYPDSRTVEQWTLYLNNLQENWGGYWQPVDSMN